ncbi:MAG: MFS transporter [Chloroflexota bacterium]
MEALRAMRAFLIIWTGQAFSLFGSALVQFALVWWLTKTTGSATVLAGATLVALLPQIFLAPVAGALVDRWNRRRVMLVADSTTALATLGLAALFALGWEQVWHVYVLLLVRSLGAAFQWPAMVASTSLMVPERHLARIGGLNQALFGAAQIVCPPLGALLLETLPLQGVLLIDFGTALLAVLPLLFVAVPQPARPAGGITVLADLREGLGFVWHWRGVMLMLVMAAIINLLHTPCEALVPILAVRYFGGGIFELAWLQAALGFGFVAGGVTLVVWGGFKRRIATSLAALVLMGLASVLVGAAPSGVLEVGVAGMFLLGFSVPLVNGPIQAVLQTVVPAQMQGRVLALAMSGAVAMSPLGLAIAGPFADAFGEEKWFVLAGVLTAALGLAGYFVPAVMGVEDGPVPNLEAAP